MLTLKEIYPNINPDDRVIFIGFDPRETMAYLIAKFSIERRSPNVKVLPLYAKDLRQSGVYTREMKVEGTTGQFVDVLENRPHSVEFSFTRFLVPHIARSLGLRGWVMFADCDFLFLNNLNKLFDLLDSEPSTVPLAVVQHDFKPVNTTKMDGVSQLGYNKKLWSAFMCFKVDSPCYDNLTPMVVNTALGSYLHQFLWFDTAKYNMINLPETYQFIPNHSDKPGLIPNIIHYTEIAPWFRGMDHCDWSEPWWDEVQAFKYNLMASDKFTKYTRFWE